MLQLEQEANINLSMHGGCKLYFFVWVDEHDKSGEETSLNMNVTQGRH